MHARHPVERHKRRHAVPALLQFAWTGVSANARTPPDTGEDVKSSIQRNIGPVALLLTGLGSIIGSGWLFGAWKAAKIAGPAAIVAWVIGAVVILAIALTYAELGAMFPESGGVVRYARYSHGARRGLVR